MDRLNMKTQDVTVGNVAKIAALWPHCVTERLGKDGKPELAVDFDKLRAELSAEVLDEGEERYQFTWPDKRAASRLANTPSEMTLRPCREESVSKDGTPGGFDSENLYIEGDNLEVLKLLREDYLGKVKMIYIDPPYNTGNDFVYNDEFGVSVSEEEQRNWTRDENGNLIVDTTERNTESNGRFHTDWLNMIYPRLKIARDLLAENGVIFISIDSNEVGNMRKICCEIFGESNELGEISNTNNPKGRSDDKFIATAHEYLLCYAKNIDAVDWYGFEPSEEIIRRYNKTDEYGRRFRDIDLRKTGENDLREDRPNLFYYFHYNQSTGEFFPSRENNPKEGWIVIRPLKEDGREGNWRWGLDSATKNLGVLYPKFMPTRKIWGIMEKDFLENRDLVKPTSSWTFKDVNSERGSEDFINLDFDKRIFPKPKPLGTIIRAQKLATQHSGSDSIILDFFSGSATTAHAVMKLNAEDGGKRKFIMVQLPEVTDEKSEARKAGYDTICEIGKERIRRAGRKVKDEAGLQGQDLDIGFRVLKLDSSNMEDVFYTPEEFNEQNLFNTVDNVKSDRTPEDLLFQVMPELNIPLSAKIEERVINGKRVFVVDDGYLVATFDTDVNTDTVKALAQMKPQYFVMRDASAAGDNVLDDFEQIFRHYSPDTVRKIL